MFYRLIILSIFAAFFTVRIPVRAQSCIPIPLVGGQGNSVTKTVSQPTIRSPIGGITIARSNWNTDWAVPGENNNFRRYIVTIDSKHGGPFDIKVYLKYSDQTADEFFNQQGVKIPPDKPLRVEATPRPGEQPYQVNVYVGSIEDIDKTYTVSAVGCY